MQVSVAHEFLPKSPSVRTSLVMDNFGIAFEQGRHVVAENLELPIEPGHVVLFTGDSGSGKSSLMRSVGGQLAGDQPDSVISIDTLDLGTRTLIDSLSGDAASDLKLLAQCGLGEARLMLRTPAELSDGQRYRFRLALAIAQRPRWIVADEFTATLDRTLAKVIAFNLRRMANAGGPGFLLATTHDDVCADLDADVHVRCRLDGMPQIRTRLDAPPEEPAADCGKKKESALQAAAGSPRRPDATGRISLGGITEVTTSA